MKTDKLITQIDCCIKSNEERDNTFTVSVLESAKEKIIEYQVAMHNILTRLAEGKNLEDHNFDLYDDSLYNDGARFTYDKAIAIVEEEVNNI